MKESKDTPATIKELIEFIISQKDSKITIIIQSIGNITNSYVNNCNLHDTKGGAL